MDRFYLNDASFEWDSEQEKGSAIGPECKQLCHVNPMIQQIQRCLEYQ